MLHFFRRIRHDLIANSKFYKYLKYAIGEIILVVIGITLAVWLNNLNLDKKQNQLKNSLIKDLHSELQFNIDRLQYLDLDNTNSIFGLNMKLVDSLFKRRINLLKNGIDSTEIKFICTIEEWRHNRYNLNSDVYQSLLETGTMGLLPDSIQKEIKEYYKIIERESTYNDDYLEPILDAYRGYKYGFGVLRSEFLEESTVNLDNYTWLSDAKSKHFIDMKYAFEVFYKKVQESRARMLFIIKKSEDLQNLIKPIVNKE